MNGLSKTIEPTPRPSVAELGAADAGRAEAGRGERLGRWLRQERELRQISLEELAQTTRIPLKMLQHLEEDRHDRLPGEVFARGFLRSYAKAIGVSESEVLDRWTRSRERPSVEPAAAPIAAITPPERSRRFGIAIALVILLILFTLALSIVLRPRHRDTPVQLSRVETALDATLART